MLFSIVRLEPASSNETSLVMAMPPASLFEPATKTLIPVNVARGDTSELNRFMLDSVICFLESPLACFSSTRPHPGFSFTETTFTPHEQRTGSINVNHSGRNTGFDHLPKLFPCYINGIRRGSRS